MADDGAPPEGPDLLRDAFGPHLHVHVRLRDQDLVPGGAALTRLARSMPPLIPFGDASYHAIVAVLDWDHRIPSELMVLRLLACYSAEDLRSVREQLAAQERRIAEANLYPEFDVPDYGVVDANEVYAAAVEVDEEAPQGMRLLSPWRKDVPAKVGRRALAALQQSESFRIADRGRPKRRALGGPMLVGWAPPLASDGRTWTVEVWLVTDFDGQMGTARVFLVDPNAGAIVREYDTTVQVA